MTFKRMEGFYGSIPQKFADNNIPKCPMCSSNNPHWSLDQRKGKLLSLDPEKNANKYLFKCELCECILQVPVIDVVGGGRSALISWQGLARKVKGNDSKAIHITIEEVGIVQPSNSYKGKMMTLEELNAIAEVITR